MRFKIPLRISTQSFNTYFETNLVFNEGMRYIDFLYQKERRSVTNMTSICPSISLNHFSPFRQTTTNH